MGFIRLLLKIFPWIIAIALTQMVIRYGHRITVSLTNGQASKLYQAPLYPWERLSEKLPYGAAGRFGLDYSCLYFAAKNYLKTSVMYDSSADPQGRPAVTFPPHLIFGAAHSLSHLEYSNSVLFSNYLQIVIFLLASLYFLRGTGTTTRNKLWGLLATGFLLFCTSVGTTWFERGQTDLYMASAYLMLIKALRDQKKKDFLLAGFLASLKWSSLPFFALVGVAAIGLSQKNRIRTILNLALSGLFTFLLLLPFGQNSLDYLNLIQHWETQGGAVGLSLLHYFPRPVAKLIPFLWPVLFIGIKTLLKRTQKNSATWVEALFWCIAGFISASFGTVAWEYKLVSMLFLIPLLLGGRTLFDQKRFTWVAFAITACSLAYAFRVNTYIASLNQLMTIERGIVPLLLGFFVFIILGILLITSRKTLSGFG